MTVTYQVISPPIFNQPCHAFHSINARMYNIPNFCFQYLTWISSKISSSMVKLVNSSRRSVIRKVAIATQNTTYMTLNTIRGVLTSHITNKVDMPNWVTYFIRTHVFEYYVVRCSYKNGYRKNTCSNETKPSYSHTITIIDSIINTFHETYMTIQRTGEPPL